MKKKRVVQKTLADVIWERKPKKKELKFHEHFEELKEDFKRFGYIEREISGYRVVNNPPEAEENFIPQKLKPGRTDKPQAIHSEEWMNLPDKIKKKDLDETALSHFVSIEQCEEIANKRFSAILKRRGEKEAEKWKDGFGRYVVKMNYQRGDGLVGEVDDKGHFNFHPYKWLDLKTRIDKIFEKQELRYETEE